MPKEFDAIIIGTGQSGPPLAARLAGAGMRVAIAERKRFGGTCVNTGCTPTKALVASAHAAAMARRAADYGVTIKGEISVDMKKVKARKDALVRQSTQGIEKWLKSTRNLSVYEGHARFEGPRALRVGDEWVEAERIFINVGARAAVPPIPGLRDVRYWTNSDMMAVDFLPGHLVILGGSYIGLEFAQMYRRFGSEVTIVEQGPRVIAREDEDVSEAVQKILEDEGVHILCGAEVRQVEESAGKVALRVAMKGAEKEVAGSHLLVAVGRKPNTDDLGLERAGIEVDEKGHIRVDDELRTSAPGVWALGDCNGKGAFTHTSYNDYEIVAANLLDGGSRRVSDRIMTYGLFIDPPLGRIGMTEEQARASGRRTLVARKPMSEIARAREKGETRGFMKLLVDAETKLFLGAAILGTGGDEVVHVITDVMYAKAPYTVVQNAVHIHPTVAELIPTALEDLKPLDGSRE